MSKLDLEKLINRTLIDILSDRILARLNGKAQSALVLFDGSDFGLEPAFQSLAKLQDAGWALTPIHGCELPGLSAGRLDAINTDLAHELAMKLDQPHLDIEDLVANHNRLILPTLSVSLAAKVATGIADSLASRSLAHALEQGKPILAARDACCPACRDRTDPAFAASKAYRAMMIGHLERLASFGVEIRSAETLVNGLLNPMKQGAAGDPQKLCDFHCPSPFPA